LTDSAKNEDMTLSINCKDAGEPVCPVKLKKGYCKMSKITWCTSSWLYRRNMAWRNCKIISV